MAERTRFLYALLLSLLVSVSAWAAAPQTASDRVFFGEAVTISEPVAGSLQVYGGDVVVAAPISGDLTVLGGKVGFEGPGRVGGNLVFSGPETAEARSHVGGRLYPFASLEGAARSLRTTAVQLTLLLMWLIVGIVWTLINGREVRFSSGEIRTSSVHSLLVGLVAFTSFLLSAVVFSMLVPYLVGIPLLAILGVFALLTKIYGMIAVFHAVGSLIAGARTRDDLATRRFLRGDLALIVVGVVVLGAIRLIPGIGPIIWSIASVIGIGAALSTRFGRREPWFLTWRPAEA
jgi:hypothetical protein